MKGCPGPAGPPHLDCHFSTSWPPARGGPCPRSGSHTEQRPAAPGWAAGCTPRLPQFCLWPPQASAPGRGCSAGLKPPAPSPAPDKQPVQAAQGQAVQGPALPTPRGGQRCSLDKKPASAGSPAGSGRSRPACTTPPTSQLTRGARCPRRPRHQPGPPCGPPGRAGTQATDECVCAQTEQEFG